jgi:hypothetical protein
MTTDKNLEKFNDESVRKYKTSDIALAATLILHGLTLLGVEPVNKKSAQKNDIYHFVFEDADRRDDLVMKYSTNHEDIKVLPNSFRQTLRHLKEMTKLSQGKQ